MCKITSGNLTPIETVRKKLTDILTEVMYFERVNLPFVKGNCPSQT